METNISIPDMSNTIQIRGFHVRTVEPGWTFRNHFHHLFELLYCWDGGVSQFINGKKIDFHKGDWLLIPPGMKHKTINGNELHFTYISLLFDIDDLAFRKELNLLTNLLVTSDDASSTMLPSLLKELDTLIHQNQIHFLDKDAQNRPLSISIKLRMQACILLVVQNVIDKLRHKPLVNKRDWATPYEIDLAFQIENLIIHAICDPQLSVNSIADKLGISRVQCTRVFSKIYGASPRQYISEQRLLLAKGRLLNSNKTIETIAQEIGFSSLSHFSRQFKTWTGVAPLKYRPKHFIT